MISSPVIYLDHPATTPMDPRVLQRMLPWFCDHFANAASRQHGPGRLAAAAVEEARAQVARLLNADSREILFTSGATESNNLALKGAARWLREEGKRGNHLILSGIEHKSIREVGARLEREGFAVTWIDPTPGGLVDPAAVQAAIRPETSLVSVMWANNEIGTINDIAAIGRFCKDRGILLHTDATQAVGKIPVDVHQAGVDLLSCSAHKLYGPKGVGALYIRRKRPRVRLIPQIDGGGQEQGCRSGTLNVPGIIGFGAAAEIAGAEMAADAARLAPLRDRLQSLLMRDLPDVAINGDPDRRLPHLTNLRFAAVDAERLLAALPGLAASSGAACTTAAMESSHVLGRIGLGELAVRSSVRFGLGRITTPAQIDSAAAMIVNAIRTQDLSGPVCTPC